jgi:Secretion system C-terminal sorting domain
MKNKITQNLFYVITIMFAFYGNFSFAQSNAIRLIAFNYDTQETSIVRWNAGETQFDNVYTTNVQGIISGSSAFDSKRSNYFARVLDNTTGNTLARLIKFNTNSESISLTPIENVFNGGSEVDMENGLVYTYDSDSSNNVFLSEFNPVLGTQTNLGNFSFSTGTGYFPDSTCYDSNSKKYYFLILEGNQVKLVTASVASQPFTYTVIPIANADNSGNIGLEFSNETNTIFAMYSIYNPTSGNSNQVMIGSLDPSNGELTEIVTLENIYGYQFSNRTYDQDSESMIFVGFNANFNAGLYIVNTASGNYEILPMLGENINELECDNSLYAEAKYGALSVSENTIQSIKIAPNPAQDYFRVAFNGSTSNYQISDVLGKIVQSGEINNDATIDVSNLSKGMYLFRLMNEDKLQVHKVIIE